jgi:hypothetical protein
VGRASIRRAGRGSRLRVLRGTSGKDAPSSAAEPFVVAELEVSDDQQVHIVIANLGTTIAENVKLTFSPELKSSLEGKRELGVVPLRETKAFTDGIPSLPPGKRFPALFDVLYSRSRDTLPDVYEVSITYDAPA